MAIDTAMFGLAMEKSCSHAFPIALFASDLDLVSTGEKLAYSGDIQSAESSISGK